MRTSSFRTGSSCSAAAVCLGAQATSMPSIRCGFSIEPSLSYAGPVVADRSRAQIQSLVCTGKTTHLAGSCTAVDESRRSQVHMVWCVMSQLKEVHALIQNDLFEMKDEVTPARRGMSVRDATQRAPE